ncbi:MAG: hypothetical protein PHQ18_03230 [Patescibacteria group bacterium]|nr:hypothetical protein [Patescibacteria group bacterium]
MDKEKTKKVEEPTKENKVNLEKKDDTKQDVPEYVGPKFYGTEHPLKEGDTTSISNESLHDLIEKNIKWSQVIYNQNKKIKRRLTMLVIGNYLRLFLILAPILLTILYLPEILAKFNEYFGQYLNMNVGGTNLNLLDVLKNGGTSNIDPAQLQKILQATK